MDFYIMVGVSGSGKSTKALKLKESLESNKDNNTPVIYLSSDEIRAYLTGDILNQDHNAEVFELLQKEIRRATKAKFNVIVDATNLTMKSRRAILNSIKNRSEYNVIAYVMTTEVSKCYSQNKLREHPIPVQVIYNQVHKFEIPFYEEGFDEIILDGYEGNYTIKNLSSSISENLINPMKGFDQRNHWHKFDLYSHSLGVANALILYYKCYGEEPKKDLDWSYIKAALLHDYGKLFTATPKISFDGEYSYYQHANVGSYLLMTKIQDVFLSSYDGVLNFLFYINYHMHPFNWNTDELKNKYKNIFGENKFNKLMLLHKYDEICGNYANYFLGFNYFQFEKGNLYKLTDDVYF